LDDAPGVIGVAREELPPLPDEALTNPRAGFLDPRAWFAHPQRPLDIEIGCGKGTFILETARNDPHTNYLGMEWAREFYMYTADRVRRAGLANVRMLHADASEFLRWRCESAVARVIHLYFSDPWPKKKHHKNRVVQDRFLAEAWRVLMPGGELRVVTDHDELWDWNQSHFARWTSAARWHETPESVRALVDGPGTTPGPAPFDALPFTPPEWVGEGQTIGTNYERKMCVGKPPHATTLRKRT
jgi:tRNA (guanine-N7-)-methyltransferase